MIYHFPKAAQIYRLQAEKEMAPFRLKIPFSHFVDRVNIFGDRLYILEKDNEMRVYMSRIVNTS